MVKTRLFYLHMKNSNQKATVVISETVEIYEEKKGAHIISLSDIEMVRLLFGFGSPFIKDNNIKRLLQILFPLNLYWGRLDYV